MNTIDTTPATTPSTAVGTSPTSINPVTIILSGSHTMNAKLTVSFLTKSSDAELIAATNRVLTALTGNTNYPAPVPALAAITTALAAYTTAVDGLDRGRVSVAIRDKARLPVVQLLRELSLYVQQTSQGDRVVLLGSGYPLQKARQPAGIPLAPQNLRLRQGNTGVLVGRVRVVLNASSYQWRFATALAPTVWQQPEPTTRATATIVGLAPGTTYNVQVRAIGSRGASDWCETASLIVN
jgi:hypothetical protein